MPAWSAVAAERPRIALAATLHDATGVLVHDVRRLLPRLQAIFANVAVATSPPTAARVVKVLRDAGVHAGSPPANLRGPLYRLSLRQALASDAERVHYLDFDRALHWVDRTPRELRSVMRASSRTPALLVGRTIRAHLSHHRPLHATEGVVNRLLAAQLGLAGRVDFLVPAFVVSRDTAKRLLARSRARDVGIYGEWAALLPGLENTMTYVECRGLDWETPDRHRRAVRRLGLAEWRRRQETTAEWSLRIDVAADIVRGFTRALARWPVKHCTLGRRTDAKKVASRSRLG